MTECPCTVQELNERVFLEHALEFYRELQRVCRQAPDGQVVAQGEQVALQGGRELIRRGFEVVLKEQAHAVEKKGRRSGPVRSAGPTAGIAASGGGNI